MTVDQLLYLHTMKREDGWTKKSHFAENHVYAPTEISSIKVKNKFYQKFAQQPSYHVW